MLPRAVPIARVLTRSVGTSPPVSASCPRAFLRSSPAACQARLKSTKRQEPKERKAFLPPKPKNGVDAPPPDPTLAESTVPHGEIARATASNDKIRLPVFQASGVRRAFTTAAGPDGAEVAVETTTTTTPAPESSSPDASALLQSQRWRFPYVVQRTPSGNLPVYHEQAGGGKTKKTTVIRKVDGDAWRLRVDLIAPPLGKDAEAAAAELDGEVGGVGGGLGFAADNVEVKPLTGHVVVKVRLHT